MLKPGEAMVTSASVHDQPFVPGVPVGTIYKIINTAGSLTPMALVRPYADLSALGVVGIVVVPPRGSPRFSVLPPIPHPGARRHRDGDAAGQAEPQARAADMRRTLLAVGSLAAALVLQLVVLNGLHLPGGGVPDLVLVLVAVLAITGTPVRGMITGFAAGLAWISRRPAARSSGSTRSCCAWSAGPRAG